MGVISSRFLCLTSPEMKSVFNAADTERHQRRRELRTVVLAADKVEFIRKAAGIGVDVESTTLHFKASS
jgi:hypothetical protein